MTLGELTVREVMARCKENQTCDGCGSLCGEEAFFDPRWGPCNCYLRMPRYWMHADLDLTLEELVEECRENCSRTCHTCPMDDSGYATMCNCATGLPQEWEDLLEDEAEECLNMTRPFDLSTWKDRDIINRWGQAAKDPLYGEAFNPDGKQVFTSAEVALTFETSHEWVTGEIWAASIRDGGEREKFFINNFRLDEDALEAGEILFQVTESGLIYLALGCDTPAARKFTEGVHRKYQLMEEILREHGQLED